MDVSSARGWFTIELGDWDGRAPPVNPAIYFLGSY
jgi:hypothetical protein